MSFVEATIESIAPHLHAGQLVILESTTYPGTTEEIIVKTVERHGNRVLRSTERDAANLGAGWSAGGLFAGAGRPGQHGYTAALDSKGGRRSGLGGYPRDVRALRGGVCAHGGDVVTGCGGDDEVA